MGFTAGELNTALCLLVKRGFNPEHLAQYKEWEKRGFCKYYPVLLFKDGTVARAADCRLTKLGLDHFAKIKNDYPEGM